MGKWNSPNLSETQGFQCLAHSNWTLCSLLSQFCFLNFPTSTSLLSSRLQAFVIFVPRSNILEALSRKRYQGCVEPEQDSASRRRTIKMKPAILALNLLIGVVRGGINCYRCPENAIACSTNSNFVGGMLDCPEYTQLCKKVTSKKTLRYQVQGVRSHLLMDWVGMT